MVVSEGCRDFSTSLLVACAARLWHRVSSAWPAIGKAIWVRASVFSCGWPQPPIAPVGMAVAQPAEGMSATDFDEAFSANLIERGALDDLPDGGMARPVPPSASAADDAESTADSSESIAAPALRGNEPAGTQAPHDMEVDQLFDEWVQGGLAEDSASSAPTPAAAASAAAPDSPIARAAAPPAAEVPAQSPTRTAVASTARQVKTSGGLRRLSSSQAGSSRDGPVSTPSLAASDDPAMLDDPDMQLHPMSIRAPFPGGKTFKALQRSRGTVNSYTDQMGSAGWCDTAVPPTLHQLEGRFKKHTEEVEGQFNVDVQVAYFQTLRRVAAVQEIHKGIRLWMDTGKPKFLISCFDPFATVLLYFNVVKKCFSAELSVIKAFSTFHRELDRTTSVVAALKTVSRVDFDDWHTTHKKEVKRKLSPKVKEELDAEAGPSQASSPNKHGGSDAATGNSKKKSGGKVKFLPICTHVDMSLDRGSMAPSSSRRA